MVTRSDGDTQIMGPNVRFKTTRWSLVTAARNVKTLGVLIAIYWKPLYFYVRQQGLDNETAKDVVQEFLAGLVERDAFIKADPSRGRFRTFLLTALANFMKDRAKAAARQKRGSGRVLQSLDFARGEADFVREVAAGEPPEQVLNRAWARSLWEQSISELKGESAHLEAFRLYLEDADYERICRETGLSESAAKTAVHRLKAKLHDIVLEHLRPTAASDEELQIELAEFLALLP